MACSNEYVEQSQMACDEEEAWEIVDTAGPYHEHQVNMNTAGLEDVDGSGASVGSWEQVSERNTHAINIFDAWERETVISNCPSDIDGNVQVIGIWERESMISTEEADHDLVPTIDCRPIVFDIAQERAQPQEERRQLCNTLWQSQCHWSPNNLVVADNALAKVGICSLEALISALSDDLRDILGTKFGGFGPGAVGSLRRHLGVARGGEPLGPRMCRQDQVKQSSQRELCNLLWEARPAWTSTDLLAAEQKLLRVGVHSVPTLIDKLSIDLNAKLLRAGLKPFKQETIDLFTSQSRRFGDATKVEG